MTLGASYAEAWGTGEPVVLVHGTNAPDPARYWAKQQPLADRWQLLVLHRRGYGANPAAAAPAFAVQVADVTASLGVGAHLVGHSYGGIIALLVAAHHPQLVRSLTLIEPTALAVARGHPAVEQAVSDWRRLYAADSPEAFYRAMLQVWGVTPREPVTLSPPQRRALATSMREGPLAELDLPRDRLAHPPFPTLLITGAWSPAFDAIADVLERQLGAERAIIPGRGHDVQATGEPFNQRLATFLERAREDDAGGPH